MIDDCRLLIFEGHFGVLFYLPFFLLHKSTINNRQSSIEVFAN